MSTQRPKNVKNFAALDNYKTGGGEGSLVPRPHPSRGGNGWGLGTRLGGGGLFPFSHDTGTKSLGSGHETRGRGAISIFT